MPYVLKLIVGLIRHPLHWKYWTHFPNQWGKSNMVFVSQDCRVMCSIAALRDYKKNSYIIACLWNMLFLFEINFYIINKICFNAFLPVLMVLPADKHFGIHILQTKAKYNIMFFENLNKIDIIWIRSFHNMTRDVLTYHSLMFVPNAAKNPIKWKLSSFAEHKASPPITGISDSFT